MVQEWIDNNENAESFQGMYDPVENNNANNANIDGNTNDSIEDEENSSTSNENCNNIDDLAMEHVERIEAEVAHRSMILECDRNADRHVHDDVVHHEQQRIELLPQTMRIVQER